MVVPPALVIVSIVGLLVIAFIVFIVFSKSPQAPIYAPNLMYESYTQAQTQAQRDGLNVQVQFEPNTTTQADGTVIAQDPAAATEMHAGDVIKPDISWSVLPRLISHRRPK